jgi:hypothetical protein
MKLNMEDGVILGGIPSGGLVLFQNVQSGQQVYNFLQLSIHQNGLCIATNSTI